MHTCAEGILSFPNPSLLPVGWDTNMLVKMKSVKAELKHFAFFILGNTNKRKCIHLARDLDLQKQQKCGGT